MKLITKEIENAFKKQGYTGDKEAKDIKIILKLFNPTGAGTWYLYEKQDEDIYWGFVNLGDAEMSECGTVSMSELIGRFGLGIERDSSFKPMSISLEDVMYKVQVKGIHV